MPAFPHRWRLGAPLLIAETFSSCIWKVTRSDGSPAVVKSLKPIRDMEDERRGAHFLAWRRGEGAVRLLGRDRANMLVEFAGARHLTQELDEHGDDLATEIAADVIARLYSPSPHPAPPGLQPLRRRFASLFMQAKADCGADSGSLYVDAASVAERLLDNQHDVRPLHGDLHHDNIMLGQRGWLAIDPKGLLGDPGFDAANMFYNPLDRDALCREPERIAGMAAAFAATMKQEPLRLLDHAFAYGGLSAAWHSEDGNTTGESRTLSIAKAIREVGVRL